ncbi:type I 3-dehydroquinate dehydratase [Caldivirga maquilingensis]|uniref:3-dehydroquinate dehydratase n=1 Tax=Caldivirga maquilingensis (strain ATCC 700844 / DSM 13496 / JCM 10307 / IC-167) TaxID=397948 RepID=A8MCK8_CALMQ|nr:type I 3-dehydroquinate dehydratase [Caldivirga maquilingensis]ABW01514.1 3-dehydroquinate dehydratase, putative [Caldivirga maquilingensis IC-167]
MPHKTALSANRPMLVCAVPVKSIEELNPPSGCEAVELRLDYMGNEIEARLSELSSLIKKLLSRVKVIVTVRDHEEGGVNQVDSSLKLKIINLAHENGALVDIEVEFARRYARYIASWGDVILSRHIFNKRPDIRGIITSDYELANSMNAFTYKVATINGDDLPALVELLVKEREVPVAIVPMQPIQRAAAIMLGTALMYCSTGDGTAPGQLSIQECVRIKEERIRLLEAPKRNHSY